MDLKDIKNAIVLVNDFPKKDILFRDITPLFLNPKYISFIIEKMKDAIKDIEFDTIASPESRGYLFGLPLSLALNKPFVMIKKPNKLPRKKISVSYELEYGSNVLEVHEDDIKPNSKVLIVDDLLATGGTSLAVQKLVKQLNSTVVGHLYLIELIGLADKSKLDGQIISLIQDN